MQNTRLIVKEIVRIPERVLKGVSIFEEAGGACQGNHPAGNHISYKKEKRWI